MPTWSQDDREKAYTSLCEALTSAGSDRQTLFLSRLCLLLSEELADPEKFRKALDAASLESPSIGSTLKSE